MGQSVLNIWLSNMREQTPAQRLPLPKPQIPSITSLYKKFSFKTVYKMWFGWSRCCIETDDAVSSVAYSPASLALPALTLILLTWRIGWAPNNASKWQMGFNSVFKGLMWDARRGADDIICCTATDVDPLSAALIPALKILCRLVLIWIPFLCCGFPEKGYFNSFLGSLHDAL